MSVAVVERWPLQSEVKIRVDEDFPLELES